jgi:hypothetical protein
MKRYVILVCASAVAALTFATVAFAQSGHFVGTPRCSDIGTQVQCTGKVAGLGGTTFTITVSAQGTASVTCTNPAGNVAPGQSFSTGVTGTSGPFATPRNGQASFTVTSNAPTAPPGSCPNPKWTATVTDVVFTSDATITLFEDSTVSDTSGPCRQEAPLEAGLLLHLASSVRLKRAAFPLPERGLMINTPVSGRLCRPRMSIWIVG